MSTFSTTTTLGTALTKNVRVAFQKGFTMVPVGGRRIFSVRMTNTKTSEHDSYVFDGFADDTGEGSDYAAHDPVKGDSLILTQGKITSSFECTKEAGMYDQYSIVDILKGSEGVGKIVAKRIELDLQLHLGFGHGTSYTNKNGATVSTTAADGNSIFYATHSVNGSAATYSNTLSTAFGQTGLETAESRFVSFLNHDGQLIDRMPTLIFSTNKPSLVNLIREYNKGMNHIEDALRGINVYMGKYDSLVLPYLDCDANGAKDSSKDDYWGMVDLSNNSNLMLEVSQEPVVYPPQMVQRNRNALVQADAHYAYGVLDPNCIVMSNA